MIKQEPEVIGVDSVRPAARMYVYQDFLRIRGNIDAGIIPKISELLSVCGLSPVDLQTRDLGNGFSVSEWLFESKELSVEAADIINDHIETTDSDLILITRVCVAECSDQQWSYNSY